LCVVWAITGVLAIAGAVVGSAHPWSRPGLAALLAAAAITLQIAPIRLGHDAQSEYLHLDEAFLVPMAIFLSAPEMAVGLALAVLAGNLWHRRGPGGRRRDRRLHRPQRGRRRGRRPRVFGALDGGRGGDHLPGSDPDIADR